jgi:hypothetical protein
MSTKSTVRIEKTAYQGWPNCFRIANGEVELIVTGDIGPRIMRFGFGGGQNLFKEYAEQLGGTGEAEWQLRGGHRIWAAPEDKKRTYAPDNLPIAIDVADGVLTATGNVEADSGLQKQIEIQLSPTGTGVKVVHRLKNTLPWPIELAPWALTMMTPGGMGITGHPPRALHTEVLQPTHPLVMWAFTDLSDPRWKFTKKYLMLKQDPENKEPQKIGHFNMNTWGAYSLGQELFLKRYRAEAGKPYADFGCSFEIFSRNDILELETLGPLQKVEPGASAEHVETWSLHRGIHLQEFTDAELDQALIPLLHEFAKPDSRV